MFPCKRNANLKLICTNVSDMFPQVIYRARVDAYFKKE